MLFEPFFLSHSPSLFLFISLFLHLLNWLISYGVTCLNLIVISFHHSNSVLFLQWLSRAKVVNTPNSSVLVITHKWIALFSQSISLNPFSTPLLWSPFIFSCCLVTCTKERLEGQIVFPPWGFCVSVFFVCLYLFWC